LPWSSLDEPRDAVGVTLLPVADLTRFLRRGDVMLSAAKITTLADMARRVFPPG
jgi:hypothetical protein